MSSFCADFVNVETGDIESVFCYDDFFGRHNYGYHVKGIPYECVLTEQEFSKKYMRVV